MLKTHTGIVFTNFQQTKLSPFQNLSQGVIPKENVLFDPFIFEAPYLFVSLTAFYSRYLSTR